MLCGLGLGDLIRVMEAEDAVGFLYTLNGYI